ncbi:MAG TPA: carboxypeptidase regulatory-like domain-containing protein [Puia sp.]|uniref:carboxypeptidase regulatory-like domain-containing protein n=1 Tax=Puia sp. TaxID=2045100 RepID=UPI002C26D341|nr:carboxypeptidase regulatory-like domain-containing protein [Puia sp.]HVU95313.1 carboxypeptidase regulatory-like domain-containing protein [Puia sp.]
MSKDLSLSILTPCSESWEAMSAKPAGRFCSTCSKTVVNFATMTDQQVLDWLARHTGSVCGRFHPDQLNRPLTAPSPKKPRRYWHYLIALLFSSSELAAQTQPARPTTTQQLPFGRENRYLLGDTVMVSGLTSPPAILHGRLVDERGRPVPYATIMYKEHKGVAADADGRFSIATADLAGVRTLTITAVGYETLKVDVNNLDLSAVMQTLPPMKMETVLMGDVVTVVRHRKRRPIADTLARIKDTVAACFSPVKQNFTIYPNPVARGNSITITAQVDKPGTYVVQLFDLSGTLLQSTTAAREQLSRAMQLTLPGRLLPGTYILRISHPAMAKPYTQSIIVL